MTNEEQKNDLSQGKYYNLCGVCYSLMNIGDQTCKNCGNPKGEDFLVFKRYDAEYKDNLPREDLMVSCLECGCYYPADLGECPNCGCMEIG